MRRSERVCAWLLLIGLGGASLPLQAQEPSAQSLAGQAAATASWPHTIVRDGASVTIYQPQAISWPERKTLTAHAALSITRPGPAKALLGTIELTLDTSTDKDKGIVNLSHPHLLSTHFPALDTAQAGALEEESRAALAQMTVRQVPLASVLLSLKQLPVESVKVNNEPPVIFYADHPTSLVVFDGAPVLVPAGTSGLKYAVNTNWGVFTDQGAFYLLDNGLWLRSAKVGGPYTPVAQLPAGFAALKKDKNFQGIAHYIPAKPPNPKDPVPDVLVSQKPAEIIITAGPASLREVAGTGLQRVVNTPNALFSPSCAEPVLRAALGSLVRGQGVHRSVAVATDKLPADFALIPPGGPDGPILASVPGTIAAQEAVLRAQIPSTAGFKRSAATLTVAYSRAPEFVPITGTTLHYAVNTNVYVLKVASIYYACEGGAWFSAGSPAGPWVLAETVPADVYAIPASSPLYPVTYVHVYAVTPTVITYGYTAGYMMGYVSYGVLVYGTGYYYPPVIVCRTGPDLLSLSVHVRRGCLVQPGQWRLGAWRHDLRALRCRLRRRLLQPEQRGVGARGGRLWSERRRRCLVGLQPEHWQLCPGERLLEQRQRHGTRQLLQRTHRCIRVDDAERESVQPLGLEHLLRRESDGEHAKRCQRQWPRRQLQFHDRCQGCRLPECQHRRQWRGGQDPGRRCVRRSRWQRLQAHRRWLVQVFQRWLEPGDPAGKPPGSSKRQRHHGRGDAPDAWQRYRRGH